jgi:hypothetical protein
MKSLPPPKRTPQKASPHRPAHRPKPRRRGPKPLVHTLPVPTLNDFAHKLSPLLQQPLRHYVHDDPGYEPISSPLKWEQVYQIAQQLPNTPNHSFSKRLLTSIGPTPSSVSHNQAYWAHRIALDTFHRNLESISKHVLPATQLAIQSLRSPRAPLEDSTKGQALE